MITSYIAATLPTREGVRGWAAAASTAGALMPQRVAYLMDHDKWKKHGETVLEDDEDVNDLRDAFSIIETVAAAARSLYREDPSHYPMPRGMEVAIDVDGRCGLVWQSDRHIVTLTIGQGGWSTADLDRGGPGRRPHWAPDMSQARLIIQGLNGQTIETLIKSSRATAAMAAVPNLVWDNVWFTD